ncbi:MAG TPA: magnesium/cobalt transporter CorA [Bryobacteraceae bacterium]|nr:magnesium/cobalt transporter CorA [Bryobacteraceae bacterium]
MDWHDIPDPNSPELDELAKRYNLHPLHIEDCRHGDQSAKVEEQNGYLFIVIKPIEMAENAALTITDFDIFLGRDFLITVQEGHCKALREILDKTKAGGSNNLRPDQVLYRVMDSVVDSYLPILDRINDEIDAVEDEVLATPDPRMLQRIFDLKRALVEMRRVLTNVRDVTGHLQRTESDLIPREMWPFMRDIYDHVARNLDMIEMQRDLVSGSLDIYLSSVANRTNQVMKVLTVLGTAATPAIVISGLYGMNLKHLPYAEHPHGGIIVIWIIVAVTLALLGTLRAFRWF